MLKTHTPHVHITHPMAVALISIAVILAIALGAVAYLNITLPVPSAIVPPVNSVSQNAAPALVPASLRVSNSVYISEQTLRNWLDDAYERHQTALAQKLQRILNGRYERRCCRLPY